MSNEVGTEVPAKTEKKPAALRHYIDLDEKRVVKASSNVAAINHFWAPKVRVASTDEVLAFRDAGGKIEVAGESA
jgi:hypothetical protein